jgi:hypothetical protein
MTKRSRQYHDVDDGSDDCCSESKKFLSEQQMMHHMQNLQLTTPPYTVDDDVCIPPIRCDYETAPADWMNQTMMSYDHWYSTNIAAKTMTSHLVGGGCDPDGVTTPSNKWDVIIEEADEDSDDASERSSSPPQVWIAPEMKDAIDTTNKSLLLPSSIVEEINKPCTALVPYIEPSHHLKQTIWKGHLLHHLNQQSSKKDVTVTEEGESIDDSSLVKSYNISR